MKPNTHKNTFLKIPTELAQRTDLNWTEKALAAQLMGHGRRNSKIFPSQDLLCHELGIVNDPPKRLEHPIANRTIRRAIKGLQESGDFQVRREGNRRNNRYLPSPSLSQLFGYEGETADSVTGQDDQSEPDIVSGQKVSSDWSKTAHVTGQKRSERLVKNGRVTGQNDPLIDSINISIEPEEYKRTINRDPDEFDFDLESLGSIFDSDANVNVMVESSNKSIKGEWSK